MDPKSRDYRSFCTSGVWNSHCRTLISLAPSKQDCLPETPVGTGGCLHHHCFTFLFLAASNPELCISEQRTKGNGEQQLLKFGQAVRAWAEFLCTLTLPLLVPSLPTVTPMVKSSFLYHEALRAEPLGAKTPWTVSKGPVLACLDLTLSPDPALHGFDLSACPLALPMPTSRGRSSVLCTHQTSAGIP